MLGRQSSGYWSPNSDFEDVEVLWPEPKRYRIFFCVKLTFKREGLLHVKLKWRRLWHKLLEIFYLIIS